MNRSTVDKRLQQIDQLNDLFRRSADYASTDKYLKLIHFLATFRSQGPYNAYLLRQQNPRVSYVATANHWKEKHNANVKSGARPMIILVSFGPVNFVYDIDDVEGDLPPDILEPFPVKGDFDCTVWKRTVTNAEANHVGIEFIEASRFSAGRVSRLQPPRQVPSVLNHPEQPSLFSEPKSDMVKANYLLKLNRDQSTKQQYITLLHELAHILCGHLGRAMRGDRLDPWRDRQNKPEEIIELEAESAAYLTARRMGLDVESESYLVKYIEAVFKEQSIRDFDLEAMLSAANRLESWGLRIQRQKSKNGWRQP